MSNIIAQSYDQIVDITEIITSIDFGLYTNKDILNDSVINNPAGITIAEINNNGEPVMNGVVDKRLGVTESTSECDTCGETSARCPGHFGHIKLSEPVFQVGFLPTLKTILSCICIRCNKLLVHKNENEIAKLLKNKHGKQRFDEIKSLVKGVTHCQKNGCGAPAHKIKREKNTYANILLLAEPMKRTGDEQNISKKSAQQILTPQLCYDILKLVSDEDCRIMGFDPTKTRPEDMIIINLPVPPIQVRPSIKMEIMTSSSIDDDLTHKLVDIVKNNENLKNNKGDGSITSAMTISDEFTLLQYHVATFFNNNSVGMPRSLQKNKKPSKSLSERLSGKEGRVRGNLMGKRVDFSGRTVITSDPNIALNEVGIPLIIAKNLTYPETVSAHNIKYLTQLVKNRNNIYPGANFIKKKIIDMNGNVSTRTYQLDKIPVDNVITLEFGDIVERHLINGDIVLFNRQPSLHKLSMMGHFVHVLTDPSLLTFRVNVSVTEPYNADYDGDEMNIHVPQSIFTVTEMIMITNAGKRLIKQADSNIAMGVKQDTIMGSFQLSHKDKAIEIDWKTAMNILMVTSGKLSGQIKKGEKVTGKMLYSQIIPKTINIVKRKEGGDYIVRILNGIITDGAVAKSEIKNIVHKIWFSIGEKESVNFIDDLQRMILQWLIRSGFTVGISDCILPIKAYDQVNTIIETKRKEVLGMITEYENDPYIITKYAFETYLQASLSAMHGDIQTVVSNNFSLDAGLHVTVLSGSKGDVPTTTQIIAAVGQQIVEGQRMRKSYNNRTLPMFYQYDDSAFARGFIRNSFTSGLDPAEFFFSAVSGREGLIATAIKSVTGDTQVVVIEDNKAKQVLIGDWIDKQLDISSDKVEHFEERDMELLRLDKKAYISTSDVHGNVSWGEITAITRHDPGKELYQIKTHGGRKVIVTESKSLLIWNNTKEIFERMSTPDVKIGDYVPVTMNLPKPEIINEYIDVVQYLSETENSLPDTIKLNHDNGIFFGLYLAGGYVDMESNYIQITTNDSNIVKKWFDKMSITYDETLTAIRGFSTSLAKLMTCMMEHDISKVPNEAFTAPDEFIIGLIEGYFSGASTVTDNCIQVTSASSMLIDGINMLLTRFGIFGETCMTDINLLTICGSQATKFANTFDLYDDKLKNLKVLSNQINFREHNDVVLDKIIEINKIDVTLYPKVYDLTIPSTLNFGLLNGLHVVDTADTGYLERKLVKILEDVRVEYDGTVRNANDKVIQFVYGDSGINTEYQIEQKIGLIIANNETVAKKYTYTKEEMSSLKSEKYNAKTNESLYKKLLGMRDNFRNIQQKYNTTKQVFQELFMVPVDINQFIMDITCLPGRSMKNIVDPNYVLSNIKFMYSSSISKIMKYNESTSFHKKQDERNNKYLLKFYLFDVLSPKRCTHEYKLSNDEFDSIIVFFNRKFRLALIEGGEMVGTIAAQSIGEPVTQSNLKSFHKAGSGKTVTAELPRVKELLSITANLKTPIMHIILNDEYKSDKMFANKIGSHLRSIVIQDIIDQVDIIYDPNPKSNKGLSLTDDVNNIFEVTQSKLGCTSEINSLPWVIRLVLSKEKMNELNVTMLEIKSSFCKNWSMRHEDSKTSKKDYKKVIDKILRCAIVSNYDNSPDPIIHIRFDSTNYSFNTLVQFQDLIVTKYVIKGVNHVTGSNDIQEENYVAFDKDGNKIKKSQFVINTDGVNLQDICQINGIDLLETTCNDIVAIYEMYGVNAAKNAFIREFTLAVISSNGIANYQHIKLLADLITHMGTLNAVNRHGANKLDTDPFSRASFEKTVEQMLAAAVFGQTDYIRSVSAKIMVGALINGGTGSFDLLLDHVKVKQSLVLTSKVEEKAIVRKKTVVSDLIRRKLAK